MYQLFYLNTYIDTKIVGSHILILVIMGGGRNLPLEKERKTLYVRAYDMAVS